MRVLIILSFVLQLMSLQFHILFDRAITLSYLIFMYTNINEVLKKETKSQTWQGAGTRTVPGQL